MADATLAFNILTRYQDSGANAAARDMNRLNDSGSRMSKSLKNAAKVGALALGAGVIFAGKALVDMTKGAIEDEAAQKRLGVALKNNTGATGAQVGATEDWISAQGLALGITDDELRPALTQLVGVTHDIGKAQKLASLAMNISAGSGKSLAVVTKALATAQVKGTSGLSKFGIATKDAEGKTISMREATKRLAEQFKGQASKHAGTLEGKMGRLKLIFDETKETIGAKLIPVVTTVAEKFLKFYTEMQDGTGKGGQLVIVLKNIGSTLGSVAGFLNGHREALVAVIAGVVAWRVATIAMNTVSAVQLVILKAQTVGTLEYAVVSKAAAVGTKIWAAGQWLLNAALTANPIGLVIVAIAALVGGLILAYKKSETFRKIVNGAFNAVKNVAMSVFNAVKNAAGNALDWIKSHWKLILAILTGPFGIAVFVIAKNWSKIREGAAKAKEFITDRFGALVDWFKGIGGKISAATSGAWDGLKNGFRSVINTIIGWWNNLSFSIPGFNKGPINIPGVSLSTPNIPYLAKGGIVNRPTLAMIGEAGPEAVVPLSRGGRDFGGGDITIPITLQLEGETVVRALLKYQRRTGKTILVGA